METPESDVGRFIGRIMAPDGSRIAVPAPVNAHTHCADGGVKAEKGMTLRQLVAPPDGLKHRYLREASDEELCANMAAFQRESSRNGIRTFVDFREGGARGCRLLRKTVPDAFIMGRPTAQVFDAGEADDILDVADGIALSSLSDVDPRLAEACSDAAHRAGKPFALHVSERTREDIEEVLRLDPAFIVHMTKASDSDMAKVADAGIPVAVCPRSNAFFGMVTPLDRMVDAGISVAFGTDNAMLCTPDLRPEVLLAADILGKRGHDPLEAVRILAEGTTCISEVLGIRGGGTVTLPLNGGGVLDAFRRYFARAGAGK